MITPYQWRTIERRSGVPRHVMQVLLGYGERSGQGSVSPKGARGRAQLMPDTAAYYQRRGINTSTEFGNVLAGAMYLGAQKRRFKSWDLAFAAYNAGPGAVESGAWKGYKETRDYVSRTMSALHSAHGIPDVAHEQLNMHLPGMASLHIPHPDLAAVAQRSIGSVATGGTKPTETLSDLAQAVETARAGAGVTETPGANLTATHPSGQFRGGNWRRYVSLAKGADRAGVHTQAPVLQFVGQLGMRSGRRLTIGTGSNHNEMTVNGNVSDHWTGMAADIPASGRTLLALGRRALMLAGMPRRQAMKATGGLFNVNGYQIIFLTNEGGNHFNHLHVGIHR